MKSKYIKIGLLILLLLSLFSCNNSKKEIRVIVDKYYSSLKKGDLDQMLNLFSFFTYFLLIFFFWGALVGRACWLFWIWKKAFKAIEKAFPEKGWRFLLRASDSDVFWLASLPSQEVFDSIMEKASYDWRWKYFVVCTLS